MVPNGTDLARAVEWELGLSKKNSEQVAVRFTIVDGPEKGKTLVWYGYFNTTDNAKRTLASLRYCGWEGDDPSELAGLDANEVEIVVEQEEYEGKTRAKVRWVNEVGSGPAITKRMDDGQKAACAERLKGLAIATRPAQGATPRRQAPATSRAYPDDWDRS